MQAVIKIKHCLDKFYDKLYIQLRKANNTKAFADPRRVAIHSQVQLSEEQKRRIDTLWRENYGEKIPYTWHRHYTAYTGRFDENYIPESIYLPEIEYFFNLDNDYANCFADKNIIPYIAQAAGVRCPETLLSSVKGFVRDRENRQVSMDQAIDILEHAGDVFCKPSVDSSSGRGCVPASVKNGVEQISGKPAAEFIAQLGKNFVIQERLVCHSSISGIYSGSVNTFRVISYRWREDIRFFPVIMRIGRGNAVVDNAHAGGMFIALDNDGQLHEKAFTEFKEEYSVHPDTNVVFSQWRIELFPRILEAAEFMHRAVPQLGIVNWDFTLDADGQPVLIEANIRGGSPWMAEMAHGCGPFGEHTAEILRWTRVMKTMSKSQRRKYEFGYNFE